MTNKIINTHPGEVLLEEFLKPMELSQNKLAIEICVPARRINEIIHGRRGITADTALRLGKFFATSAAFWLNLQKRLRTYCRRRKTRKRAQLDPLL